MSKRPANTLTCLSLALVLFVPQSLEAQVRITDRSRDVWAGWSIGVSLGRAGNEDDNHQSDDRGLDLRANIEVPLGPYWITRLEAGRVSWRYDQFGPQYQMRRDDVTARRLTVGVFRTTDPANLVRGHIGGGFGLYHWSARTGTIDEPAQRGVYFAMGLSIPVRSRDWCVTGELQAHVINSPNRGGIPGPDGPVSGTAVMTITPSIGLRFFVP